MAHVVTSPYSNMRAALGKVIAAHASIRQSIADHADKYDAALDARRRRAESMAKIEDGIARANRQV